MATWVESRRDNVNQSGAAEHTLRRCRWRRGLPRAPTARAGPGSIATGRGPVEEASSMGDRRPVRRRSVRLRHEDFQWLAGFARQEDVSAAALAGHAIWLLRMRE